MAPFLVLMDGIGAPILAYLLTFNPCALVPRHFCAKNGCQSTTGVEVIAMGDFNISHESSEYSTALLPILGLKDAFRNAACFDEKDEVTAGGSGNDLQLQFEGAPIDERLDYVLYSHGNAFDVLPTYAEVRQYVATPPISGIYHLSDHYGVVIEFSLYR